MEFALEDEVSDVNFGDKRLNRRLGLIAKKLDAKPNLSIPAATGGRAEMEAAYRFFANENISPDGILQTHYAKSIRRAAQEAKVLLVQDTTELDLTRPNQQVKGAGPMSSEKQFGAFVHPLMAFSTQGIPLGLVWHKSWARTEIKTDMTPEQKREINRTTPIENKESYRWLEAQQAALKVATECPNTVCVLVADSEADIYELLCQSRDTGHDQPLELLIRACQPRATTTKGLSVLEQVRATPCRYTAAINISSRKAKTAIENRKRQMDRPARSAEVEVRACTVTLRAPYRPDRKLADISVNVVLVEETATPAGQVPIQWILFTTLPIDTDELVREVVENYCERWGIEVFFKTLKSGCRVEERQFESLERELNCVAVYLLVAWRVLLFSRLGRECPDMDCEVVYEASEWKAVYLIVKKTDPPSTPPTLNEMNRMVATLGGYVNRKKTHPGTETLWIGIQRMHDMANCYDSFGPPSRPPSTTCVVR